MIIFLSLKIAFEGSKSKSSFNRISCVEVTLYDKSERESVRVLARVETGQRLSPDQNRSCLVENEPFFSGMGWGIICNTEVMKNSRICGFFFSRGKKLHLYVIAAKQLPSV